jgi:hypothetical protein
MVSLFAIGLKIPRFICGGGRWIFKGDKNLQLFITKLVNCALRISGKSEVVKSHRRSHKYYFITSQNPVTAIRHQPSSMKIEDIRPTIP